MADDNTLNVKITSDIAGLKKGLVQADKGLKKFDTASKKVTKSTSIMGKKLSTNAVPAMTSFSQVIQDAPYGIQGVANNITQLTAQFGNLSTASGGAKGALKGMLGVLSGPAGILLAVSVVTSLLVSYGGEIKSFISGTKNAKDVQDKLNKKLEEYENSLIGVRSAMLKGSQSSAKEITNLRLLKSQLDNTNLSNNERLKALNELQKKYPAYLGNVTNEDSLVGGLDTKYDELTTAILKSAKAKAASDLISKNFQKLLTLQLKLESESTKLGKEALVNQNANNELKAKGHLISQSDAEYSQRTQKRYDKALKTAKATANEIINIQKENKKLSDQVTAQGGIIPTDFGGGKKDKGTKREVVVPIKFSLAEPELDDTDYSGLGVDFYKRLVANDDLQVLLKERDNILNSGNTAQIQLYNDYYLKRQNQELTFSEWLETEEAKRYNQTLTAMHKFNEKANEIITSGIANTFAGLGTAIGEALASGGNVLQAIGSTIIQGLADFLGQMGKMLIEYGTLAVLKGKLDLAILAGGPVAIGAGLAAIAVGIALSAASAALGSFASSGGSSGGGSSDNSNFKGGSSSSFSSGGSSGGTYVFEIAGTKLVGVLKNTLDRNKALGGSLSIG